MGRLGNRTWFTFAAALEGQAVKTIEAFTDEIARAATILWNGPMGVFEVAPFAKGTFKIAHAVAENVGATSIVGGGDSVSAVNAAGAVAG